MQDTVQQPSVSQTQPFPITPVPNVPSQPSLPPQATTLPQTQVVANQDVILETPAALSIPIAQPSQSLADMQPADNPLTQSYLPSTSSPHPEHEPLPPTVRHEWTNQGEKAPEISQEVKESGVEVVQPVPQVPVQAQVLGVTPAKETTPMIVETELLHTPITLLKALDILKTDKDNEDSFRWFATLIVREIAVAQRRKQLAQGMH